MNSNNATEPNGPVPFLQEKRILLTAALVLLADQLTKQIVINWIDPSQPVSYTHLTLPTILLV